MAGRDTRAHHAGLGVAAACLITIIFLAAAQLADGRIGTSCEDATNSATFTFTDPGLELRVSGSYNDDFSVSKIAASYKGTSQGTPTFGAGSCTDNDSQFSDMDIALGGKDDSARLDARKPATLDSQAPDPIPSYVAVVIDGGGGADVLRGHKGQDTMYGGKGNDVIRVKGGGADIADCGPGRDKAIVSGADQAIDCELSVSG